MPSLRLGQSVALFIFKINVESGSFLLPRANFTFVGLVNGVVRFAVVCIVLFPLVWLCLLLGVHLDSKTLEIVW